MTENWGAGAVPSAGFGAKDRLREAIQRMSVGGATTADLYLHTGWKKVDGKWLYLHAGEELEKTEHN